MNILWRTFNGNMPKELIPLYETLQSELNYVLSNEQIRHKILHDVDYTKHRGDVLSQYINLFGEVKERPNWNKVPSKGWYFRMLLENVRRTYESLQEKYTIYTCLKENDFNLNDLLYDKLRSKRIYTSSGNIRNIIKQAKNGSIPTLPRTQTFVMDYSISVENNCLKLDNQTFKLRFGLGTNEEDYLIYHIDLPTSLRLNLTGKCAKPRFYKNKFGKYVADLAYEVKADQSIELDKNVLGVDLGIIKLYSATVLYKDGSVGQEYVQSKALTKIQDRLEKLYSERKSIYDKQERSKGYQSSIDKFKRRTKQLEGINLKITKIKDYAAKLIANEIVELAKANSCDTIAMENLHWLDSTAGKWNHSAIQDRVKEIAELYGIKLERVNCANSSSTHPITGEVGVIFDRRVRFKNGVLLDRDHIASVNIANRVKRSHTTPKKITKSTRTPVKFKRTKSYKEVLADMKSYVDLKKNRADTEVVVFAMRNEFNSPHFGLVDQTESSSLLQKGLLKQYRL